MSASAVKLAYEAPFGFSTATFFATVPSLPVGDTTTCSIGIAKKATNGCQKPLLLILLPWYCQPYCQSLLKRSLIFSHMCSRILDQQSC